MNEDDGYDANCPKHGGYCFNVGWGGCPRCLEEISAKNSSFSESNVDKPTCYYYIDPLDEHYKHCEDDERPY